MLRSILTTALLAGLLSGLVVSVVQAVWVTPRILAAEHYEHGHDHGAEGNVSEATADSLRRTVMTTVANVLTGVGFALLLAAGLSMDGGGGWRTGLLWGLGGFAAFTVAPSLGLPPSLPGMPEADLAARQGWWVGAAIATAAALWMLFRRGDRPLWAVAAIALLTLPHLVGAPVLEDGREGPVPVALATAFAQATVVTSLIFWSVLGSVAGLLLERSRATAGVPA